MQKAAAYGFGSFTTHRSSFQHEQNNIEFDGDSSS